MLDSSHRGPGSIALPRYTSIPNGQLHDDSSDDEDDDRNIVQLESRKSLLFDEREDDPRSTPSGANGAVSPPGLTGRGAAPSL